MMNGYKIEITTFGNKTLKDINGKSVHLGDKVSFNGAIAEVVWWQEQGRFYLDFGDNNLIDLVFYTWLHEDFEVVSDCNG